MAIHQLVNRNDTINSLKITHRSYYSRMSAAAVVVSNNNDNLKAAPRSSLLMKRETNSYGSPIGEYKYINVIVKINSRNTDNNDDDNEEVKQQLYHHTFRNHKVNHYGKKKNGWKVALETMVIIDESCTTIDDWFHLFLSDDAPHSFKKYQTDVIGDTDIVVQNWEGKNRQNNKTTATNDTNVFGDDKLERSTTYLHPIIPGGVVTKMLGSSTMTVETFQHQAWSRFGHYGAVLTTTTKVVGGTMMGDCFHVETEWLMEQQVGGNHNNTNDSSNPTTIKVSVRFRIVFTKRTMFQGVITKSVAAETQRWFDGYEKMMAMTTAMATSTKVVEDQ